MNALTSALTHKRSFCRVDKLKLFSVNAGVPVELALEQASTLLGCIEALVLSRGAANDDATDSALQYLTQMTRAVVDACHQQDPVFLAQAHRMAKAAHEPKAKVEPVSG
ncbi:DUF3077 domain-containing protein [Pseudomonas turukhanskensis]|uniref:DUF3077 domain-containing protein n=1 Tax=Pseudomonas turukhanskensis TaxID=1806536 RepID=A0A9W6K8E4_9PSED|nr:DUF3077 domain-containing protein [Pseudomonas turukhanskensis]GLK89374.1 hypothetical protein GCM10017655_24360 [Pseudomonas turukhanskensis]